jgi:disulfide bond formation protein DsbB
MKPGISVLKTLKTTFCIRKDIFDLRKMFTFHIAHIILLAEMKFLKENLRELALFQSIVAAVGSLYFSEVMKLVPCVLCWYQRIFMYPLILIIAVGIWKKDKNLPYYALPFSISGLLIAIYHNLLYYGILPESTAPCTLGISCTTRQIEWFGFITIPLMSLVAFAIITVLMSLARKEK